MKSRCTHLSLFRLLGHIKLKYLIFDVRVSGPRLILETGDVSEHYIRFGYEVRK